MILSGTNMSPPGGLKSTGSNRSASLGSLDSLHDDHDTPSKDDRMKNDQTSGQESAQGQAERMNKPEGEPIGNQDLSSVLILETPKSRKTTGENLLGRPHSFRRSGSVKELRNLFDGQGGGASCAASPYKTPQRQGNTKSGRLSMSCSSNSFLALSKSTLLVCPYDEDDTRNNGITSSFSRHNNHNSVPPARSSTANATFDCLVSPTSLRKSSRGPSTSLSSSSSSTTMNGLLSPEVAVLQKRLAEVKEKLQNQEARHIQERLSWQGQTMEVQRLRKERDRLLEDQNNERRQLLETESIAEAVMAENKKLRATCDAITMLLFPEGERTSKANASSTIITTQQIDWEAKLNELRRQANSSKEHKIGELKSQLEETSQHLLRETELNTEVVIQLNEVAGELRRQSSQKDLKLGVLAAQLDEKEQQLQLETEINTQIVASLRANEHELRRQTSEKDLMIERLMEELNESKSVGMLMEDFNESKSVGMLSMESEDDDTTPAHQDLDNECTVENLQKAHDQLKNELEKTKVKDMKIMSKLRKKLAEEKSKLKRERKELDTLKRAVVKESVESVAVMSRLRDLLEELQQKIDDLQAENATLKSSLGVS